MPSAELLLYPEDFAEARPRPPASPVPVEPTFSAEEVAAARAAGRAEGERDGHRVATDALPTRVADLLDRIADRLDTARDVAATEAEIRAVPLAGLLRDALAAAFPAMQARFGEAEIRRMITAILPALARETQVTIHVAPSLDAAVQDALAALPLRRAVPPRVVADAALAEGDIEILWDGGRALRDAAALWREIDAALGLFCESPATE